MKAVEAFLNKMEDGAFRAAFEGAGTPEAKEGVLAGAGLDISVEEAEAAWGGLSDEELDQVAGGDAGVIRYPPD